MSHIVDLRKGKGSTPPRAAQPLPLPPQRPLRPPRQPLRTRRLRRRLIFLLGLIVLCLVAAGGVSYASYVPALNIQTINVEGASAVSPQLIQQFAQQQLSTTTHPFISHNIIFFFNTQNLLNKIIAEFPRLQSATASRASLFSNDLTITVSEREPYALWCEVPQTGTSTQGCYDIDQSGFIFSSADDASSTPPSSGYIFLGGLATSSSPIGQSFVPAHLPGIESLLTDLGQNGFTPLGVQVEGDGEDFEVPLSEGFYINASFGEDPGTLAQNLQLVLSSGPLQGQENNLEYVDLRFGDKVYYKFKGGSQQEASTTTQ